MIARVHTETGHDFKCVGTGAVEKKISVPDSFRGAMFLALFCSYTAIHVIVGKLGTINPKHKCSLHALVGRDVQKLKRFGPVFS